MGRGDEVAGNRTGLAGEKSFSLRPGQSSAVELMYRGFALSEAGPKEILAGLSSARQRLLRPWRKLFAYALIGCDVWSETLFAGRGRTRIEAFVSGPRSLLPALESESKR